MLYRVKWTSYQKVNKPSPSVLSYYIVYGDYLQSPPNEEFFFSEGEANIFISRLNEAFRLVNDNMEHNIILEKIK